MPSPNRDSGGGGSKIAYTRWEPLETQDEDTENQNNNIPFHTFVQEEEKSSTPISRSISRRRYCLYEYSIKTLGILIIIGLSWIVGFMSRWGIHHYYVDPRGHCVTPVPYQYDPETAQLILEEVGHSNIAQFLGDYTSYPNHQVGTQETDNFAQNISELWKDFGLDLVEIDHVNTKVPIPDQKIPSGITISDSEGNVLHTLSIPFDEDLVSFTPSAIEKGRLVYGHFGRFADFSNLQRLHQMDFNNSVVIIKVNHLYHTGSMVRNAQNVGAKAVILFPDPFPYTLSKNNEQLGKLPSNTTLSTNVKFVPGDPDSPYLEGYTMPSIPVIGINYDQAKGILLNYTNANGISHDFWYGLPLNTSVEMNFTAQVEVYRENTPVKLNNVIGTLRGRYEPTRYIIIASHHDSNHQGAARPGISHAVLMELVRTFGYERMHGWRPGRSIIFASWDGEEIGQLGSTAWMFAHQKELISRAVVYIDLDHLLQGNDKVHVTASPLLK